MKNRSSRIAVASLAISLALSFSSCSGGAEKAANRSFSNFSSVWRSTIWKPSSKKGSTQSNTKKEEEEEKQARNNK